MAKYASRSRLGVPTLTEVSSTALMPLGTIVEGYDTVIDANGEYRYVRFGATVAEGEGVYIDDTNKCILADSDVHANDGGPIGVGIGAAVDTDYGFVQISGKIKVKTPNAVAAGGKVFLNATGGAFDDAAVAGAQVLGAEFDTADGTPAAGYAYVTAGRMHVQGQIT